ncbi:MAG: deoxyguanosinetriphosphate triphosphohydrolase [bacterium]
MQPVRLMVEEREAQSLSPYASLARCSAGRQRPETEDPVRTCYQRDRDRVLHSKPFRRLKHKTQVFIEPVGDHYRTRLTHSLEVAQISRTVARALRLNEDLTEAIALAHDVGHPPFGHGGEQAIDEVLRSLLGAGPKQFRHYDHSLRIVDVLLDLNLTQEVRQGIAGHSKGQADLSDVDGQAISTLEAAVVRVCDRVAYLNHDMDDAVRSGMVSTIPTFVKDIGPTQGKRIGRMVEDVIVHSMDSPSVNMSAQMQSAMNDMKDWLFTNVYLADPGPATQSRKAQKLIHDLLLYYIEPGNLPEGYEGVQGAVDYVAGMTDRYAMAQYERLFLPTKFRENLDSIP